MFRYHIISFMTFNLVKAKYSKISKFLQGGHFVLALISKNGLSQIANKQKRIV